jgi:hypothetical protein
MFVGEPLLNPSRNGKKGRGTFIIILMTRLFALPSYESCDTHYGKNQSKQSQYQIG